MNMQNEVAGHTPFQRRPALLFGRCAIALTFALVSVDSAHAADSAQTLDLERQMTVAFVAGSCTALTTANPHVNNATNKLLHFCEYVSEISATNCASKRSCPTYEHWSLTNPAFSPELPRSVFLAMLDERRSAAGTANNARAGDRAE